MKKKIYYLSTCTTCKRIMNELHIINEDWEQQDIKREKITPEQLDEMAKMAGNYEALFSRKARKYREMDLKDKSLGEQDYQKLILEDYTFLKRPVMIIDDNIFIGNAKKTIAAAARALK